MPRWSVLFTGDRLRLAYFGALSASAGLAYASRQASSCEMSAVSDVSKTKQFWPRLSAPSHSSYNYLIAGGGTAAASALQELYLHAKAEDRILLVAPSFTSDERFDGKALNRDEPAKSFLQSLNFLDAPEGTPAVELVVGQSVERVDPVSRTAALKSGKVSFDKCLLAFGGDAGGAEEFMLSKCVAPDAKDVCCYVHSCLPKVDALLSTPRGASTEPPHITVIGGSWTAASLAASLLQRGSSVSLSYSEPAFLARHFPKYISQELVSRFRYLSDTVETNFDTLSYSALKYVTLTEIPHKFRTVSLGQPVRDTEATVHMSLVFDAYDLVHFRTDLVVFAPTKMPAPRVLKSAQRDDEGLLVASPELSVYSDVYAAGACLADNAGASKSAATWSSMRASETGAHAARNMMGGRQPFQSDVPRFEVTFEPLSLRLLCVGEQDGSAETFGYFLRSRDRDDATCGGELKAGVLFYTKTERQEVEITGMCIWDGEKQSARFDSDKIFVVASAFLKGDNQSSKPGSIGENSTEGSDTEAEDEFDEDVRRGVRGKRIDVEEQMRAFASEVIGSDGNNGAESAENESNSSAEVLTSFHRPARPVRIRDREIMFVGDEKLGATTGSSPKDKRAVAFDALMRKSMEQ